MDEKVLVITTQGRTGTIHIPDIKEFVYERLPVQHKFKPPYKKEPIDTFCELYGTMKMKDGREFWCSFHVDGNIEMVIKNAPFKITRK